MPYQGHVNLVTVKQCEKNSCLNNTTVKNVKILDKLHLLVQKIMRKGVEKHFYIRRILLKKFSIITILKIVKYSMTVCFFFNFFH